MIRAGKITGESVGSEPRVRRITGRQQHRENVDSSTPEYYRRSVILPFLDHLITDMKARFNSTATAASQVLSLVPKVLVEQEDPTAKIAQLGEIYAADLLNPTTLSTDIRKWRRKWDSTVSCPTCLLLPCSSAIPMSSPTSIPCSNLPARSSYISATENECSHSALKHLKQYLRSTMGADRLSSLALMQIHCFSSVDFEEVVSSFARQHPRRMYLSNPVADSY